MPTGKEPSIVLNGSDVATPSARVTSLVCRGTVCAGANGRAAG